MRGLCWDGRGREQENPCEATAGDWVEGKQGCEPTVAVGGKGAL